MNRAAQIEALGSGIFDVLIIGGGITGAGVALDAAARGLRVALVEKKDFAHGTSSRSSKLIHGGLRYLKQGQIGVTMQSVRERERLLRNAPHLVKPLRFLLPHRPSLASSATYAAGLWLYDTFARAGASRRHRHLDRGELRRSFPLLGDAGGAFEYFDAMADDCRLVMHVLKKAAELGAVIANYAGAAAFDRGDAAVADVAVRDSVGGQTLRVRARTVVNATGVWCDEVRRAFDRQAQPLLQPSKGAHLVIDNAKLPLTDAIAIPNTSTGQHLFLVPWAGRTLVGTTDTPYDGPIDRPTATAADMALLLDGVNEALPSVRLRRDDIISVYAGLRPLLSHPGARESRKAKRDYTIERSGNMITVTGGKLTTYREMAERVANLIAPSTKSSTATIELFPAREAPRNLPADVAAHLLNAYGSEAAAIAALPHADIRLAGDLPYTVAEVDHVVRTEMAMSVSDVLLRRLRLAQTDRDHGRLAAPVVAERIAAHHGLGVEWRAESVRAFGAEMAEFALPDA
jgi:glycerol-3-phosphate dehydrogenase